MRNLYCISGLGADERVFRKIRLKGYKMIHIPWPEYDEHDELPCYAQKVAYLIKEKNPLILGVSLGGMVAVEIAKYMPVKKLVIVSSAKTKDEMPPYTNIFGRLMKSGILPPFLYKTPNIILFEKFGTESEEDDAVLSAILRDSDGKFMRWAMKAIAVWDNETIVESLIHIHGTNDKIIFPDNISANYWIDDGGHMMIYNRAAEVSKIIQEELDKE